MKSYVVKEREDGSRFFDENTPTGQVSEDTIGAGLKINAEGKVVVDKDDLSSDFVKKTGDTMTGALTTESAFVVKNKFLEKGTLPTNNAFLNIEFVDKTSSSEIGRLGSVYTSVRSDGSSFTALQNFKNEAGSSAAVNLNVGFDADGNYYTQAPTPPLTDNSSQIATTRWCSSKYNRVTGVAVYVRKSGDDANDGFSEENAVLTLDRAKQILYGFSTHGAANLTLDIGEGEWDTGLRLDGLHNNVLITGAGTGKTIISMASNYSLQIYDGGTYFVRNLTIRANGAGGLYCIRNVFVETNGIEITGSLGENGAAIDARFGAVVFLGNNTVIKGISSASASYRVYGLKCVCDGSIILQGNGLEISGSGYAAALSDGGSKIVAYRNNAPLAGAFTGKKYAVYHGSMINSNDAGENFLPGTEAGIKDASSSYF